MATKYSDLFTREGGLTGIEKQARALNIGKGGFEGIMPRLGAVIDGTTYQAHLSSALYVGQNVIAKVLAVPGFYKYMPEPEQWAANYVMLIEELPKSITGFNSTMAADVDTFDVGGTGEQQTVFKKLKRTRTNLTFEIPEKMHKTVSRFIGYNLMYGGGDYITDRPLASDFITNLDEIGGGWTPDMYTGTVIFIEPDVTRLDVVDCWLALQFWFTTTGDRTAKRNLSSGGDTVTLNLETAGIYIGTGKVFELARTILPKISNIRAVPDTDLELPNDEIEPEVSGL